MFRGRTRTTSRLGGGTGVARFGAAALLVTVLAAPGARVWAHQDPSGCDSTGVDFAIGGFRADGTTPVGLADTVSECETLCVRAIIMSPEDPTVCAFQGGTLSITTPTGTTVVADMNDIPCLGGTTPPCVPGIVSFQSDSVCFAVRAQDVVNGTLSVTASYAGATGHTREGDQANGGGASIGRPFAIGSVTADAVW